MDLSGFGKAEIPAQALAELQSHFDEADLRLGTPRVREHELGCDILVNVEWFDHDDDGPGHAVKHTVVFLHRPQTTLPEFEIRPRAGLGEKALGLLASALGTPALELDEEPEFTERYSVMTVNPESVKVLLGREQIDSLVAVGDLFLKFGGRGVLASRRSIDGSSGRRGSFTMREVHDHRVEGADIKSLLEDALIAGGAIVDDPALGRRAADAVEGSYASEAAQHLEEQGGLIGRQISKTLVTSEMLQQLQKASVPRTDIPAPIARRAWGGTTFPLIAAPAFGLVFLAIGIVVLIGDGIEGLAFAGIGGLALLISAFVLRLRLARRKLVIHGAVVEGRVTAVDRTDTSVNDDPIHKITITPSDGSEPIVAKMGSAPAKQARRLMQANRETWILRDPSRPAKGLWIGGWSLETALD